MDVGGQRVLATMKKRSRLSCQTRRSTPGALIFDPEVAAKFKDCGISVLDDAEQVLSSVLIYLGEDPDTSDPARAGESRRSCQQGHGPSFASFMAPNYIAGLAAGDLCVAMGYSGDMLVATNRAKEAGNSFTISYRLPKRGQSRLVRYIGGPG